MHELSVRRSSRAAAERLQLGKERRENKKRNEAWSSKTGHLEKRNHRREKRDRKNAWLKAQAGVNQGEEENLSGEDAEDAAEDWEELKREDRTAKKAKRIGLDTVGLL